MNKENINLPKCCRTCSHCIKKCSSNVSSNVPSKVSSCTGYCSIFSRPISRRINRCWYHSKYQAKSFKFKVADNLEEIMKMEETLKNNRNKLQVVT